MYFLDLSGLIQHLKERKQTQAESLKYLLGFVWLSVFTSCLDGGVAREGRQSPLLIWIVLILVLGSVAAFIASLVLKGFYRRNGGDRGEYFLERLLALAWVVGLRVLLVLIPVRIFWAFADNHLDLFNPGLILGSFVVIGLGSLFYFVRSIDSAFMAIAGPSDES